jgi:Uma2 family endonuclease
VTDRAASAVLTPLDEYLATAYQPDRDYLDGVLLERNVGEIDHSDAQTAAAVYVRLHAPGFWAGVEVRVQVKDTRFRVPDVTVVRGPKPAGRVILSPPEVAIEVLSPDDRVPDIQSKIDDFLAFGIPCVWVIDPESRRAWIHTSGGTREVADGMLRNLTGDLTLPLSAIFPA